MGSPPLYVGWNRQTEEPGRKELAGRQPLSSFAKPPRWGHHQVWTRNGSIRWGKLRLRQIKILAASPPPPSSPHPDPLPLSLSQRAAGAKICEWTPLSSHRATAALPLALLREPARATSPPSRRPVTPRRIGRSSTARPACAHDATDMLVLRASTAGPACAPRAPHPSRPPAPPRSTPHRHGYARGLT